MPLANPYSSSVAYRRSPAKSPVKGRPVRLAPCSPGASPTISKRPSGSPNGGTGALNQFGSRARTVSRKVTSLGQSGQLRSGTPGRRAAAPARAGRPLALVFSILEIVVFAPRRHGGRTLQELRRVMARLARSRTLGGIAAELGLQFDQVGEDVGLASQFIGDHRRLARNRRDHGHPHPATLDRLN